MDDRLFVPGRKLRMNVMYRFFTQSLKPKSFRTVYAKRRVLVGCAVILSGTDRL